MSAREPDYYKILQVDPAAEPEVIDAAYRRLARKYHPDSGSPEASGEHMKQLNTAHEIISNPEERRAYDQRRKLLDDARRKQLEDELKSRAEKAALVETLLGALMQERRAVHPTVNPNLTNVKALDGSAVIKARDGTYLGLISSDRFEADSISNTYGSYGSPYSATSIKNEYCQYGGSYGAQSPFNQLCFRPPVIVQKGRAVAYLTVNPYLKPAISPHDLLAQLGSG